jgi:hypothetical protein
MEYSFAQKKQTKKIITDINSSKYMIDMLFQAKLFYKKRA